MKPPRRQASRPRLSPLAAGLALALASATLAAAVGSPIRDPLHMPALSAALAGRDTTLPHGWARTGLFARDEIDATVDAWLQRGRIELPSLLHDTSRGGVTHVVTNCNDAGAGSFRDAFGSALDNDTVDLSALACSEITLTTGSVLAAANNLTVVGPGMQALTIRGGDGTGGMLVHLGSGNLTVQDVQLRDGLKYATSGEAGGGCIRSSGSVTLIESVLVECWAETTDSAAAARGGAIFATGDVILAGSAIAGSGALNSAVVTGDVRGSLASGGGAVFAEGGVSLLDSLVIANGASSASGLSAAGGIAAVGGMTSKYSMLASNGALIAGSHYAAGATLIRNSTITANVAALASAGVLPSSGGDPVNIVNSTIAGNESQSKYGMAIGSDAVITNSTIARNSCADESCVSAGLHFGAEAAVQLQSTIVAENILSTAGVYMDISGSEPLPVVSGGNNLVTASMVAMPFGTLTAMPKLGELRSYGAGLAPVLAMPLKGNSPALNTGNNMASLQWDQRGSGFPRVSGPAADIGAFEMNWAEYLFADDFGDD